MVNRIIISLLFALISMVLIPQTKVNAESLNHLAFKGIPINGTLNEYTIKMQQNGFVLIHKDDGYAMFNGDFAAYKNCVIAVSTLKQKDMICKISVIFPECNTWSSLSSNYFSLKEMLTEKYGKPSDCTETFQSIYQPKDDSSKMHEVMFDKCKYYSIYETKDGDIELSIRHDGVRSCFVTLVYYDKINCDIIRAKAMNDI